MQDPSCSLAPDNEQAELRMFPPGAPGRIVTVPYHSNEDIFRLLLNLRTLPLLQTAFLVAPHRKIVGETGNAGLSVLARLPLPAPVCK